MRWLLILPLAIAAVASPAAPVDDDAPASLLPSIGAPDILGVLDRSQQRQLDALTLADAGSPSAQRVRATFDTLLQRLVLPADTELRIVRGALVAETLHGRVVIANEALGDLTETERLFVLAHELGHVVLHHWAQTGALYKKWVPGEVTPQRTDPIAEPLGRDASQLAYRQEFEADAFGLRTVRAMGLVDADAIGAFMHLGVYADSATHPGTRKRVMALRAIEPDSMHAAAALEPER